MNNCDKIIFNFLPIGAGRGGGLQNSLGLLATLSLIPEFKSKCFPVAFRRTAIADYTNSVGLRSIQIGQGYKSRLLFELGCRKHFPKGQLCFTLFGPAMLRSNQYLVNVNGCAYSNLFYPEIDFWSYLDRPSRLFRKVIDIYRCKQTQNADYWIFETEILRNRAINLCHFPEERTGVVKMAPSKLVGPDKIDVPLQMRFKSMLPNKKKFLFLCGSHPNKRLHLLPQIANNMRQLGCDDFCFVTTVDDTSAYFQNLMRSVRESALENHFKNIGSIASEQVASLISCIDFMCNFSVLESFSNNFVEAWYMKKPLVVTNGDWSKDSCGSGAFYVDPLNALETAKNLIRLVENKQDMINELIHSGSLQINKYPTPEQKCNLYFEELKKAQKAGFCPDSQKKRIVWAT